VARESEDAARLRADILAQVREHWRAAHAQASPFEPGRTPIPYAARVFGAEEVAALVDSSLEFWLTYGRFSAEFERALGEYLGVEHCYLVNSGSSANLLALMALTSDSLGERALRRGDEVITVAAGFPTTVAPIVQFGAVPVFVDVEAATCDVDASQLASALSPRTRAVFLAHTLGNPFDLDAVTRFCREHGLWLVEDNCDSLGSVYRGRLTGTFGDIGTSSFYPPHHMTMGEGGAVYTSDPELARILVSMRDWGRDCTCPSGVDNKCGKRFDQDFGELPHGYDHKYVYSEFGYNLKATDMQAAIGVEQLKRLPEFVEARRRNWAFLRRELDGVADVVQLPEPTQGSDPSWFGFLMLVREDSPVSRDAIVRRLEAARIQTRMLFAGNMVRQPCFDGMRRSGEGYRVAGELAVTDRIMNDAFWVGVYPGLTEEMLGYMAESIRDACRDGAS
jgi:CDP-4-dehydro-6-deoxyglucose reductase, E1